jgi:aryl carrier-like protein
VAALFSEVLRVETVGAFDNFFALGGDSLRGFQVLTRIRAQWQVDVSILDLFKEPTVAQLAATVASARQQTERVALERILSDVENISDAEAGRLVQGDEGDA